MEGKVFLGRHITKGIINLKENGRMSYLIPRSIFKKVFSQKLREYMLPHLLEIHDYDNKNNSNQNRNSLTSSAVIVVEKNNKKKSIKYINECNKKEKNIYKKMKDADYRLLKYKNTLVKIFKANYYNSKWK